MRKIYCQIKKKKNNLLKKLKDRINRSLIFNNKKINKIN